MSDTRSAEPATTRHDRAAAAFISSYVRELLEHDAAEGGEDDAPVSGAEAADPSSPDAGVGV